MLLLLTSQWAAAVDVDISNPMNLVFVADRTEHFVDVIDTRKNKVVFRIDTPFQVDRLVVTPFAPLLFIANIEQRLVVAYNLKDRKVDRVIKLAVAPRHMVLDTTGKFIGISDSEMGGIAILSSYSREVLYQQADFPVTGDLLFDPNEVELYYSNNATGSLGLLDLNTYSTAEIDLVDGANANLSAPSRSLDGRYIYVADATSGKVFSLNSYSGVVYKSFDIGTSPARPYTTPEGVFLLMLDSETGRFVSVEQNRFTVQADTVLGKGLDLVTVGRFDRINLLLSSRNDNYYLYDNLHNKLLQSGQLRAVPFDAKGSIDGKRAYVAFHDAGLVAVVDMENQQVSYIKATQNGSGAFAVGATNNVCH